MAGQLPVRIREKEGRREVFDPVRKRFVPLTPEEAVRQSYLRYLVEVLGFPLIALTVEKKVDYNGLTRRYDLVACRPDGGILLLVECKAESVPLSGDTLYQAAMYNHVLQADFVVLFNGKEQFVCHRTPEGYRQVPSLPPYREIC